MLNNHLGCLIQLLSVSLYTDHIYCKKQEHIVQIMKLILAELHVLCFLANYEFKVSCIIFNNIIKYLLII
jgi:hypothetical protein